MSGALRWLMPEVPLARLAWFRAIVALTAVVDIFLILSSPRQRATTPALYDPIPLARALQLPAPTPTITGALTLLIVAGALGVLLGGLRPTPAWVQHLAGAVLGCAYLLWCTYGMSFGYVAHDHTAIIVAALLLPTAGTARYVDLQETRSTGAGWALRMVQVFTVATYTGSVLAKWVMSGHDLVRWAQSGTFVWAFLRRPNPLNELLVQHGAVLRLGQWGVLALELAAPLVWVVRERWRWVVAAIFLGFHLATFALLGIHFLPTLVCWAAFLPLERYAARIRRRADIS
ncbi:hypothetical protein [Ornithinimicrobium pratense]|uniref:HTTM domain-containing protein n=1 Tax=Ornithinimicrobium pratense TaxID=2593973 RepID=A0A5J6V499_9MICO|nr:hypothetical protein [Ornithinimicrobium pratense]QFG68548.1 hypothetical protein FY030_07305 [Ornithinimicrobium pratense]